MTIMLTHRASCDECGFATHDVHLLANHSCDVTQNGGRCEDWPCCGHEAGDCNGRLYGSDEAIKAQVEREWDTGHGMCEHEAGIYNCEDYGDDDEEEEPCRICLEPGCRGGCLR